MSKGDHIGHKTVWQIDKYRDVKGEQVLYHTEQFEGNVGLNQGIAVLTSLLMGNTATAFGTDTMIGVGNGTTAGAAAQTGLQGASKQYVAMITTNYPSLSNQTVSWKGEFATNEGNFDWEELTISNDTDDTGENLVREVISKGTKVSGERWDLTAIITFS